MERGGDAAANLRRFYGYLRSEMLRAQFAQNPDVLERASSLVLQVREAWQQVDSRTASEASLQPQLDTPPTPSAIELDCRA